MIKYLNYQIITFLRWPGTLPWLYSPLSPFLSHNQPPETQQILQLHVNTKDELTKQIEVSRLCL